MRTIEGNKIIAEFMGVGKTVDAPLLFFKPDTEGYWIEASELKYHSSWDWLMPVVEKIEAIIEPDKTTGFKKCTPYRIDILGRNIVEVIAFGEESIFLSNTENLTKIEAVWLAVFEFIQWHTSNTETKILNDGN